MGVIYFFYFFIVRDGQKMTQVCNFCFFVSDWAYNHYMYAFNDDYLSYTCNIHNLY
jgi:hypothetical protein